jgi:hypothetical protein
LLLRHLGAAHGVLLLLLVVLAQVIVARLRHPASIGNLCSS